MSLPLIHVGFTGTRHGMRSVQMSSLMSVVLSHVEHGTSLRYYGSRCVAHAGDCLGADAEFARYARSIAWITVCHPPTDPTHRAFCDYDETREPLTHMRRNREIVREATLMLATPYEMSEQLRGGTWATIRMARKAKKPLIIVYPDGSTEGEWK